jgi:hypothetical protein
VDACDVATRRSRHPVFRGLLLAIAAELELSEELDRAALVRIVKRVLHGS